MKLQVLMKAGIIFLPVWWVIEFWTFSLSSFSPCHALVGEVMRIVPNVNEWFLVGKKKQMPQCLCQARALVSYGITDLLKGSPGRWPLTQLQCSWSEPLLSLFGCFCWWWALTPRGSQVYKHTYYFFGLFGLLEMCHDVVWMPTELIAVSWKASESHGPHYFLGIPEENLHTSHICDFFQLPKLKTVAAVGVIGHCASTRPSTTPGY